MRPGEPAGSAIARSVDLARHVEGLGIPALLAGGTPLHCRTRLLGHVGADWACGGATKTIRVGSGGVMLPNHAPLVVAEQFGTLEALYPGRIDLGLGRAPGGDFATMRALRRDLQQSGDDFPALLEELRTYLGPEKPGQAVKAIPGQGSNVPITLLGRADSAPNWQLCWACRLLLPRTLLLSICMQRRKCTAIGSSPVRCCASRTSWWACR
jgi:alkanesulfonate monooxygenase SsuD/methylene tetrahydromethanopterin reductase-like flavin-dependent oxidoreductase (luciferase family)